MSSIQYILASLWQYRRIHLSVGIGVMIAGAVITGALLVGDSMRGSLRGLALDGLGRVDTVVLAEQPFRAELADELIVDAKVSKHFTDAHPLLITRGVASFRDGDIKSRAANLSVHGVPESFWSLGLERQNASAAARRAADFERNNDQVALSKNVAEELRVEAGDTVLLRIPLDGSVPADSTLGEKEDASASRRVEVAAILDEHDSEHLARFSLQPNQQAPRNVFVLLSTLQSLMDRPGRANAIALGVAAGRAGEASTSSASEALLVALRPRLTDYGLAIAELPRLGVAAPRIQIAANRLVLNDHVVQTVERLFGAENVQPAVTYLANTIEAGDKKIPYSTVSGLTSTVAMGPLLDADGQPVVLAGDEVALIDWAAEDLDVQVGDEVTLTFYEPETTHGELVEHEPLQLKLRHIAPLADTGGQPTAVADPAFAPELPGVTDQRTISDWDLPFELVEEVRRVDEDYWEEHRTTPKAYISLATAKRLWPTRWGTISVMRLPATGDHTAEPVAARLQAELDPDEMGVRTLPVKANALAAASGTTPFDGLFIGFSSFLMASAVMLIALLFRLGIEQRAREVGLLLATGVPVARVRRLLSWEAALVSIDGAIGGVLAGIGYAWIMIYGLNNWWVEATAAPFLRLHVTPRSLAIGFVAGILAAMLTILWTLRQLAQLPARQLLAGDAQPAVLTERKKRWTATWLPLGAIASAVVLAVAAWRLEGEAQAGAFFGGGTLMLIGLLAYVRSRLSETETAPTRSMGLDGLAVRNARRNPGRTILALGLAATASFLIVALSAFRLAPTERGVGGFDLIAKSDLPLYFDPNTREGRESLGMLDTESDQWGPATVVSFRMHDGEDASCLNLFQTTQPTILGAPAALGKVSDFAWAARSALPAAGRENMDRASWRLLSTDLGNDDHGRPVIPVVLDRNTAYYSLKKYQVGAHIEIRDGSDRPRTLEIVGMLANSVLQGDLIISDENFVKLFPNTGGRRFFLMKLAAEAPAADLATQYETHLQDYGFDVVNARGRLSEFLAVQNTYLSTFQSLGAFGLLLGAVGLAVVQLRSVIERRGELALMRAAGFRSRRLARLVLSENLVLLLGGLAIGCAAALAAVIPHAAAQQASTPWGTLAVLMAIVAVAGAGAGWLAVRAALAAPLMPSLRGD